MELSALAARVLLSADIALKLRPVAGPLTDAAPGPALRVAEPARPRCLRFRYKKNGPPCPAAPPSATAAGGGWPITSSPTTSCRPRR